MVRRVKAREQTPPREQRHRLQFEFSPDAYARLQEVRQKANASSYAQLVRDAISTYEWLLDKRREGYRIELSRPGEPTRIAELIGRP
jgi:hypothetical protein